MMDIYKILMIKKIIKQATYHFIQLFIPIHPISFIFTTLHILLKVTYYAAFQIVVCQMVWTTKHTCFI